MQSDKYPETIDIKFDRDALCLYWRLKGFIGISMVFIFIGGLFGLAQSEDRVGALRDGNGGDILFAFVEGIGIGVLIALAISLLFYAFFQHRQARRRADKLVARVEGAFLRVIDVGTIHRDRKLHFRSILDYSVTQGWLRKKMGIESILLTTPGASVNALIQLPGVEDWENIRDMLAAVDAAREA